MITRRLIMANFREDKLTSRRLGASPENAVAGTAESILDALTTLGMTNPAEVTGLLFSAADVTKLRTSTIGAASTGAGIGLAAGERFYLPSPFSATNEWLYEAAAEIYVAVFY
jgi:hypothetical protein